MNLGLKVLNYKNRCLGCGEKNLQKLGLWCGANACDDCYERFILAPPPYRRTFKHKLWQFLLRLCNYREHLAKDFTLS